MKREDVKTKIPGITDEQLDWLMGENGKDVTAERNKAANLQSQLDTANAQLKTAQEGLEKFKGVDVDKLQGQVTQLQNEMKAQADAYAFDTALDAAIRDAGGRSVRAIRGMLDLEALKASKDRTADITAAVTKCKTDEAWAFGAAAATQQTGSGMRLDTGAEPGAPGTPGDADGVTAAFAALNPGLKL